VNPPKTKIKNIFFPILYCCCFKNFITNLHFTLYLYNMHTCTCICGTCMYVCMYMCTHVQYCMYMYHMYPVRRYFFSLLAHFGQSNVCVCATHTHTFGTMHTTCTTYVHTCRTKLTQHAVLHVCVYMCTVCILFAEQTCKMYTPFLYFPNCFPFPSLQCCFVFIF